MDVIFLSLEQPGEVVEVIVGDTVTCMEHWYNTKSQSDAERHTYQRYTNTVGTSVLALDHTPAQSVVTVFRVCA